MSRFNILHGRGTFGSDFQPGVPAASSSSSETPTEDVLPNTPTGRLFNWFVVPTGNTFLELERARRYVRTNRINDALGQDASQLFYHANLSGPLAAGVKNLILYNIGGLGNTTITRYQAGSPVTNRMGFDARQQSETEGLSWLYSGLSTLYTSLHSSGVHFLHYGRRPPPGLARTNAAPRSWATDLYESNMNSLTYWRASLEERLLYGCAGEIWDASGQDYNNTTPLAADTSFYLAQALRTAGTYTATQFPGHTGTFTNGRVRRPYFEAVPLSSAEQGGWVSGLYSWAAFYWTMEASIGNAARLQPSDAAYAPIYMCHHIDDADETGSTLGDITFRYNKVLSLLLDGKTVAADLQTFTNNSLPLDPLIAASA